MFYQSWYFERISIFLSLEVRGFLCYLFLLLKQKEIQLVWTVLWNKLVVFNSCILVYPQLKILTVKSAFKSPWNLISMNVQYIFDCITHILKLNIVWTNKNVHSTATVYIKSCSFSFCVSLQQLSFKMGPIPVLTLVRLLHSAMCWWQTGICDGMHRPPP